MEGGTKLALLLSGGLVLGCAGLGVLAVAGVRYARGIVADSATQDPAEVLAIGRSVGDFVLPPGYAGASGIELPGIAVAVFSAGRRETPLPILGLVRTPVLSRSSAEWDPEQLLESFGAGGGDYREEARRELPIQGAPRELIRSRGHRDGEPMLREIASFVSGDERHLIVAMGPAEGWDQQLVDAFFLSID